LFNFAPEFLGLAISHYAIEYSEALFHGNPSQFCLLMAKDLSEADVSRCLVSLTQTAEVFEKLFPLLPPRLQNHQIVVNAGIRCGSPSVN
jgi:hypothetical protein